MEVLSDTIDSGDASINITEEDMQQVKGKSTYELIIINVGS